MSLQLLYLLLKYLPTDGIFIIEENVSRLLLNTLFPSRTI